jgi:hypothetical protein
MRLHRPSPALVIAFIALLVALASPAGAAVRKLVTGKGIASNAITSSKVKNGSLLSKDFKQGQLPAGAKGATGLAGATGPKGETGAKGDTGLTGLKGDKGDTGPTVVGGANDGSGTVGPMGDANLVTDLASGATTSGQVTLPWRGTIYVNGLADLSTGSVTPSYSRCSMEISDGTGPTNGLTTFSPLVFGNTDAIAHIALPLAGQVTKNAGTYNIGITCHLFSGSASPYSAGFTFTAVPAAG